MCPIGTIDADDKPASACETCPAGTDLSVSGLVGACADRLCMAGTTDHDSDPRTACFDCGPGYFIPLNGSFGACSKFACAAGRTDADMDATTACVACDPGTGVPGTASTGPCTDYTCAAGTTDHDSKASTACAVCGAGGYVPAASVGACATFACEAETVDADLNAATPCVAAITCKAGEMQQAAPTTTSQRVCASCVLGVGYTSAAGSDGCTATTQCTEIMFVSKQATLTTDRACLPLSPSCAPGTEWETVAPTATADRVCKPLSNVTFYLRVPFADFAGSLQLRADLEASVRTATLNSTNAETAAAIVRVLFFPFVNGTSQIEAVVQVLAENANAVYYLQEAVSNNLLKVKLANGKTATMSSVGSYQSPANGAAPSQSSAVAASMAPVAGALVGAVLLVVIVVIVALLLRRRAPVNRNSDEPKSYSHLNPSFSDASTAMNRRASWMSGSLHGASNYNNLDHRQNDMHSYVDTSRTVDDQQSYYDTAFMTNLDPVGGATGYLDVRPEVDLYETQDPMQGTLGDTYLYSLASGNANGADTETYLETVVDSAPAAYPDSYFQVKPRLVLDEYKTALSSCDNDDTDDAVGGGDLSRVVPRARIPEMTFSGFSADADVNDGSIGEATYPTAVADGPVRMQMDARNDMLGADANSEPASRVWTADMAAMDDVLPNEPEPEIESSCGLGSHATDNLGGSNTPEIDSRAGHAGGELCMEGDFVSEDL